MKLNFYTLILFVSFAILNLIAQDQKVKLTPEGYIPAWLVAGPFDQPLTGFGIPSDSNMIDEQNVIPAWGKEENDALVSGNKTTWIPQSISSNGFLDLNSSLRWNMPSSTPEKIWFALAGYASAIIESPVEQNVKISFGSNSFAKILLNGKEIYSSQQIRNAKPDNDLIDIKLNKGENLLLVKTGNSQSNIELAFFEMIKWEWGFYLRLLDKNENPLQNIEIKLPQKIRQPKFDVVSTFFFKKIEGALKQRIDIEITSPFFQNKNGKIEFDLNGSPESYRIDSIPFGISRHSIFISELKSEKKINTVLNIDEQKIEKKITLFPKPHYELHMMMLAHTDIGYTHPQPVVKEIHANTLDDVISMCEKYPDFNWTIETLWQLEQYESSRTEKQFKKVIELIKQGRIAVSPLYSNPFTGWVGEEELIRSLDKAKEYQNKYGLKFDAAVYNDVPGQSWALPQLLNNAGVKFLAEGINEVYNDYTLQQSLPKVFNWEGSDGSKVVTYLNEAYNEGKSYGLENRGNYAVQQRLWERINKLNARGYKYDMILVNSAFGDNTIIPTDQYLSMKKWNDEYEYPKFISSNVSKFSEEFLNKYEKDIPTIRGDWTSNWDVFYQGEPERMMRHRFVQHNLLSAEKLATLSWLLDKKKSSLSDYVDGAYHSLLNFSGHGSGLEYGYGSPADNLITQEFRDSYVYNAFLKTEEVIGRASYRISKPEESFEGEGIMIFNPLSWERDAPVEVQFPEENLQKYDVIDLVDNKVVPSFRSGYKLMFVARDLPSLGYKKYRLQPSGKKDSNDIEGKTSSDFIENKFYKIRFDLNTKKIISIVDKKSGKEIANGKNKLGFNDPLIERFQNDEKFSQINYDNATLKVIDEQPVRIIIEIERPGELFSKSEYILWNQIHRIDIEQTVDLEKLRIPDKTEEYGLAFPFELNNQKILVETLGGFLDPDKDKLPGTTHEGFSIRRTVAVYNDKLSIVWSSPDARVVRLRTDEKGNKVLISNILNNFPKNWNRYEENEGELKFTYSITTQSNFSEAGSSRFGWEVNTPPIARKSWYRSEPATQKYFDVDNKNISILSISASPDSNSFDMRLMNLSNETVKGKISSRFFENTSVSYTNYLGNFTDKLNVENDSVTVKLGPNEITTIKFVYKN